MRSIKVKEGKVILWMVRIPWGSQQKWDENQASLILGCHNRAGDSTFGKSSKGYKSKQKNLPIGLLIKIVHCILFLFNLIAMKAIK